MNKLLEPLRNRRVYILDSPRELGQASPIYPFAAGEHVLTEYLDLLLNRIHVDFIEIDNPMGSSVKTRHAVIATSNYENIVIHVRAHPADVEHLVKNIENAKNIAIFTSAKPEDLGISPNKHFSRTTETLKLLLDLSFNVRFAVENFYVNCRDKRTKERVLNLYRVALNLGVHELDLPDTSGLSNPLEMYMMTRSFTETLKDKDIRLHIHSHASPGHEPLEKAVFALAGIATVNREVCIHTTINGRAERGYIPSLIDTAVRLRELGAKTNIKFGELINLYNIYSKLFWWSPGFNGLHPPIWLDPSINAHYSGTHYSKILRNSTDYDSNPVIQPSTKISHVSGKYIIKSIAKKLSIKVANNLETSRKIRETLSSREALKYISPNGQLNEVEVLRETMEKGGKH